MRKDQAFHALFSLSAWNLPSWAADDPSRLIVTKGRAGARLLHTWDLTANERPRALVTEKGSLEQAWITRDGRQVWWFQQQKSNGTGTWWRTEYETLSDVSPVSLPPGRLLGASVGAKVAIAALRRAGTSEIYRVSVSTGSAHLLYTTESALTLGDLNSSENLVYFTEYTAGSGRPAKSVVLQVEDADVETVLPSDGQGHATALDWHPDGHKLLARVRNSCQSFLGVWQSSKEIELLGPPIECDSLSACWFPDGSQILLHSVRRGRTRLHAYTPGSEPAPIGPSEGHIAAACVRPDGEVWLSWSSATHTPRLQSADGTVLLRSGDAARTSITVDHTDVSSPHGAIHCLIKKETGSIEPAPTVFFVHGGPAVHDKDEWDPVVTALICSGYTVVQVNYRGSTGFGPRWLDAALGDPGISECEDIEAVREYLIAKGVTDEKRAYIYGASWGGYISLLSAGLHPSKWAAVVAEVPVADYSLAYEDEVPEAQEFDRFLFGGDPDEAPERYARASPISYVDSITCPVFMISGLHDAGCSVRQARSFRESLIQAGGEVILHVCDMGHGTNDAQKRITHITLVICQLLMKQDSLKGRRLPCGPIE